MDSKFRTQVDIRHYKWGKYITKERWQSYYHQIDEVIKARSKKVLVIGKGDGIVPCILSTLGIEVVTFDFDETLHPDILGDLRHIDEYVSPDVFDTILCCEVLEHIPFKYFEEILKKISLLKPKHFIISIPNNSCRCKYDIRVYIPHFISFKKRKIAYDDINSKFRFNGEHYWEIGVKGKEYHVITQILNKYFNIKSTFFEEGNEYHCFFVLKEK